MSILNNLIIKAEEKLQIAIESAQAVENYVILHKFGVDKPTVSIHNDGSLSLDYGGCSMTMKEVEERMKEYGYITPNDF